MSIDLGAEQHRLLAALEAISKELDGVSDADPIYLRTSDKKAALVMCSRIEARLAALKGEVLASADDVAIETGARSASTWLATETRDSHGATRRAARLAEAVGERHKKVGAAMARGDVNAAQAHVITDALDALPKDLDPSIGLKAERHLVEKALEFGPRDLKRLGQRILEAVAPEIADAAEYQRLLAEERRARKETRLTFRPRGDGSTDVHVRLPDAAANRLRVYLDGFTSPRSKRLGDVDALPLSRRRGLAFRALLEGIPASGLPRQGGTATHVAVTIPFEALVARVDEAGLAVASTGDTMTAGEARRHACLAGLIPFVLGGRSVILDQGRKKRLYDEPQRYALELKHPECTAPDCHIPAAWCHAHHKKPWSEGGKTDLDDGTMLCPFHHDLAHDPEWDVGYHPDGSTTFTKRVE